MTVPDIRRLTRVDLSSARAMNALFAEAFDDAATYRDAPPDDAYLAGLLARDGVFALVATEGQAVIGALVAYELPKFEQARSEIYIYDLAVAETHRRRGVASALIARLQALAAEHGAWVIFVQGDYGDDPALALYRKLGVQEEVLHFDLPVRIASD